jgi:Ca2+-binding EF-hand superfamily protein
MKVAFEEMEGSNISPEEFKQLLEEVDYDKNGKVNYNEFLSATVDVSTLITKQKLAAVFA